MSTTPKHTSFRIGDRVRIELGPRKLTGVIVDDRGPLGIRGRRLFDIEIPLDPEEPMRLVMREDEMEAIAPGSESPPFIDKKKAIAYLANGGLHSMLLENMAGGRNQPQAWLCLDTRGNITHTYYPERGVIGGQVIPSGAMREGRVFAPKRDVVATFLESFGLTHQEAERVISEVGTAR
jgi:hypothetical protein